MRFMAPLFLSLIAATTAFGRTETVKFLDDRSSPERVVESLYNAINRQEYLRAWSYFKQETAPDFAEFSKGYEGTVKVELRTGKIQSEGAAGSIHSLVPVAIKATQGDDGAKVFTGCYRLTQVQPAAQVTPPYRPIETDDGKLSESDVAFTEAMGECTP